MTKEIHDNGRTRSHTHNPNIFQTNRKLFYQDIREGCLEHLPALCSLLKDGILNMAFEQVGHIVLLGAFAGVPGFDGE